MRWQGEQGRRSLVAFAAHREMACGLARMMPAFFRPISNGLPHHVCLRLLAADNRMREAPVDSSRATA